MTTNMWDESPEDFSFDIYYYLHLLRQKWKFIAALAISTALIVLIIGLFTTPTYSSTTTLYVDAGQSSDATTINGIRASESLARTYAELLKSRPTLLATIEELDLTSQNIGVNKLRSAISVSPVVNTQLLRIRVEDSDSQRASDVANTLATVFITQIRDIQTSSYANSEENLLNQLEYLDSQKLITEEALTVVAGESDPVSIAERNRLAEILKGYNQDYSSLLRLYEEVRLTSIQASSIVRQTEEATAANGPIRPRIATNTLTGLILGLFVAAGIVLAREIFDDTVRNPDELGRRFGVPVLVQVMNFDAENQKLLTATSPRSPAAEAFRSLRLNLKYASVDTGLRSVLVTSASPSEGKSTLASNLCAALAQGGQDVILIDGDLRRPRVHKNLGVSNRDGLSDLFIESSDALPTMLQPTIVPRLSALVAGPLPPNPSELLDTAKSRQIIEAATDVADIVVVDAPPIMAMTDAVALSQYVDGVILVVRAGSTRKSAIETSVKRLQHVNAKLLGFAITDIDNVFEKGGYYYYKYYQDYLKAYSTYYNDEPPEEDDDDPKAKKAGGSNDKKPQVLGRLLSLFKL